MNMWEKSSIKKLVVAAGIAGILCGFATFADGYSFCKSTSGARLHWAPDDFPLVYYISDTESKSGAAEVAAISRAFDTWRLVGNSTLSFRYRGKTTEAGVREDGRNTLGWVDESWLYGPETIAHTTVWVESKSGKILEADIEFNAEDYRWSTFGESGTMDIQNVTTHEAGHFLGLGHSIESTRTTMFPIISLDEINKRYLEHDDRGAAGTLYLRGQTVLNVFDIAMTRGLDPEIVNLGHLIRDRAEIAAPERVFLASAVDIQGDGTDELALIGEGPAGKVFYIAPSPVTTPNFQPSNWFEPVADRQVFSALQSIVGIAKVEIDMDENGSFPDNIDIESAYAEEIAVMERADNGGYQLMIYRPPAVRLGQRKIEGPVLITTLWDGRYRNVLKVFSTDIEITRADGGSKNLAAVCFDEEARYYIVIFSIPTGGDTGNPAVSTEMVIPFDDGANLIDICSINMDVDGEDGTEEIVALVKDDAGYSLKVYDPRILPNILPNSTYADLWLVLSRSFELFNLDKGHRPVAISAIDIDGDGKKELMVVTEKTTP